MRAPEPARYPDIAPDAFTGALSAAANGVCVVTAAHAGRRAGLTVSSMCSVCAEPALLLACVSADNAFNAVAADAGAFAVNILEARHVDLALVFAGLSEPPPHRPSSAADDASFERAGHGEPDRFGAGTWTRLTTGAPVLDDALVALDCELDSSFERGTHRIWIGRVVGVRTAPGVPLVYTSRAFASALPLDVGPD